ncbi:uncharacterized protein LOC143043233 [Mytilus galloprovincialis]|uniref:Death domain-containing protein n=1 Tax=Mytilus galloprovincialis TaxID=29158 RepID=A0A8B6CE98_MYTGA|nr:Hypothetical predicted protein [Mytilus galloprovincialis]
MSLRKFIRKRRKKDVEDWYTGDSETEDQSCFVRNGTLRRSYGTHTEFIRNGTTRRSLDNYQGMLHLNTLQRGELKDLRQQNEFQTKRANMLEAFKENQPNVLGRDREDEHQKERRKLEILYMSQEKENKKLEKELEKYKKLCHASEKNLKEQCERSNNFEKQMVVVLGHISKLDTTTLVKEDIEQVIQGVTSQLNQHSKLLSTIDERTLETSNDVKSLKILAQLRPEIIKKKKMKSLPEDVKSALQRLASLIGPRWQELIPALGLSPSCNELGNSSRTSSEKFWRIIQYWYNSDQEVSLTSLITACRKIGIDIVRDKPMPEYHQRILQRQTQGLINDIIDVHHVVPYLQTDLVMSITMIEYIYSGADRSTRILRMLDSLTVLGENALPVFVKALRESGHDHLAENFKDCLENGAADEKMALPIIDKVQCFEKDSQCITVPINIKEFATMKTKLELCYAEICKNEHMKTNNIKFEER